MVINNFKSELFGLNNQNEYMDDVTNKLNNLFEDTPNSGIEEAFEGYISNADLASPLERDISYYLACEIFHSVFSSPNKTVNIEFKGLKFKNDYIDKVTKSLTIQARAFDITILHRHQ